MSDNINKERNDLMASPADGHFSSGVELLSKALRTVFTVLAVVIVVALIWFLSCGGSFIVNSTTESVVVLQFGKYYKQYDEGWHWFLPYPINKVIRISTVKRTVRSTTFVPINAAMLYDPNAKPQSMSNPMVLIPGADGYALLGDNSIMHSDWVMTYKVTDPTKYFLSCMSRETQMFSDDNVHGENVEEENVSMNIADVILQNLLDDAVIVTSASLDLKSTYYDKNNYEQSVKAALIDNLEKMDIGISLESLSLQLVKPPLRTAQAFQELLLAETTAEANVEAAKTYSVEQENSASSEAAIIKANAEAYKSRVVSEVQADTAYFKLMLTQYQKDKKSTLISLFNEKLGDALAGSQDSYILYSSKNGNHRELRLKLNPEPLVKKSENEDMEEGAE